MSSVHNDPSSNGTTFDGVTVTVDLIAGDCVIHSQRPGPCRDIPYRKRFHSIDEIQGAYQVQFGLGVTDPVAANVARALKFAATQLMAQRKGDKRG
jgi:hypothetical protein